MLLLVLFLFWLLFSALLLLRLILSFLLIFPRSRFLRSSCLFASSPPWPPPGRWSATSGRRDAGGEFPRRRVGGGETVRVDEIVELPMPHRRRRRQEVETRNVSSRRRRGRRVDSRRRRRSLRRHYLAAATGYIFSFCEKIFKRNWLKNKMTFES